MTIVGACIAGMCSLIAIGIGQPPALQDDKAAPTSLQAGGDLVTYERIVDRLDEGQGYYSATHAELLEGNFPTRAVFNWRTPAYPLFLALVSPGASRALLALLALTAAVLLYRRLRTGFGIATAAAAMLALTASLATLATPKSAYFSETAAGVLILLSVAAYSNRLTAPAVLAGLAALFVRELAAPYVVICLLVAWRNKRWTEVGGWAAGLAVYASYFAFHFSNVVGRLGTADRGNEGWIDLGGPEFVLTTASYNGVLVATPLWVAAVFLPLGLLGLYNWSDGMRGAATLGCFVLLFAFIGNPFNGYWGLLYTPLMMLGVPLAVPAIAGMIGAGGRDHQQTEPQSHQSSPEDGATP